MNQNGKFLFMHRQRLPTAHPNTAGMIHLSTYNYLCGDMDIIA